MLHRLARSPLPFALAALAYPLLPGHWAAWSDGLPLDSTWLGVVVALVATLALLGRAGRLWGPLALGLALLCLLKLAAWSVSPTPGLVARYYSYDDNRLKSAPERSTDFTWLDGATRIDRRLGLSGDGLPLYFFNNNQRWNNYKPSETPHDLLPFAATWDGYLVVPRAGDYRFWLSSEGPASLSLGGVELLRTEGSGARATQQGSAALQAGLAPIHAEYTRLERQGRRLRVEWDASGTRATLAAPDVLAFPLSPPAQRWGEAAGSLARATDALYLAVLGLAFLWLLRLNVAGGSKGSSSAVANSVVARGLVPRQGRMPQPRGIAEASERAGASPAPTDDEDVKLTQRPPLPLAAHVPWRQVWSLLERLALVAVVLVFFWQALGLVSETDGRMVYLRGGEDPLTHETQAREIGLNGPLMRFDAPFGRGKPYYAQVLYPYLLAAIHHLAGEPLSGVYVVQVTLVGALVVLVYLLSRRLFGVGPALLAAAGFGWLAWTQYVPVALTLFAEVLYTPLIAAAILALVAALAAPNRGRLLAASLLLALAILTRFTGLLFVPVALLVFWLELRGRGWSRRRALAGLGGLLSALLLGLALVTARNLVVASTFAFMPTSAGNNLAKLHKPSSRVDLSATESPVYDALWIDPATRQTLEFLRQDPVGYARTLIPQGAYAAGYTRLVDYKRPYEPLFLGGMLLYLAALALLPRARARPAWLAHGFVLGHWVLMAVFFASQYRYRLILPMYPFVYAVGALAAWQVPRLLARGARLALRLAQPPRRGAGNALAEPAAVEGSQ